MANEITVEEYVKLNKNEITLLDIRNEAERLIKEIPNTLNITFEELGDRIDEIDKNKEVIVICRVGDISTEVVEILLDREYKARSLKGGANALFEYLKNHKKETYIDAKGMACPGPIVALSDTMKELNDGDRIKIESFEDAFYYDVEAWTNRTGHILVSKTKEGNLITAIIEKNTKKNNESINEERHDKTFVVFDDSLDKAIAAFIMANGAAAMGRKVTVFFTFWGINILRKAKKAKIKKTFIEKMFGKMMPRGTKKLKLSQMNMGGMGPKMIRSIMKKKDISSLEELMQSAIDHGVHVVVCQMSMDIMGIKKEELIDGVEFNGVASFLGSCETSDATLFI